MVHLRASYCTQHDSACPVKTQCCGFKNMRLLFTHLPCEPLREVCNTAILASVLINLKMAMLSLSYIYSSGSVTRLLTMQYFKVDFLSATMIFL